MVYTDVDSLANSIMVNQKTTTVPQAMTLVQHWAGLIRDALVKDMENYLYMPGVPVMYHRTGQIFNHVQIAYHTSTAEVTAEVHYTRYPSESVLGGGSNRWDVMLILEHGYSASDKMPVWMRNKPYFGFREGGYLMEHVARQWAAQAKAQGVDIRYTGR